MCKNTVFNYNELIFSFKMAENLRKKTLKNSYPVTIGSFFGNDVLKFHSDRIITISVIHYFVK